MRRRLVIKQNYTGFAICCQSYFLPASSPLPYKILLMFGRGNWEETEFSYAVETRT